MTETYLGRTGTGAARPLAALLALACALPEARAADSSRQAAIALVRQVQRADYEGDRAALKRLHAELAPLAEDGAIGPRVRYWRGFALWRRAVNGFNEATMDPEEQEKDLEQAAADFGGASAKEPGFVDAKVGALGSLGLVAFLHAKDAARLEALRPRLGPLLQELREAEASNPRVTWVLGPMRWNAPRERGWGHDRTIESYEKALELARKERATPADPLSPSWGEPELLMSLAWSQLNKSPPDLAAAERNGRAALALVPHWHYVRDILLPQILKARAGAAAQREGAQGK